MLNDAQKRYECYLCCSGATLRAILIHWRRSEQQRNKIIPNFFINWFRLRSGIKLHIFWIDNTVAQKLKVSNK